MNEKVHKKVKVPMQISSVGELPFDHTYIDFVGPIKTSITGNKYIFTATCDLTKYLIAIPTVDSTALTAAKCILNYILLEINFPSVLISDNASSFTSKIIEKLANLFQIKLSKTTPYHPQANIVERQHRTLNAYLRAYTEEDRNQWDDRVKCATYTYNNTVHSTTGFTPHTLLYGFSIKIPTKLKQRKPMYNYDG